MTRFNRRVQDELRLKLDEATEVIPIEPISLQVSNFETSATAMYAVGGGGPFNEVVLLTDPEAWTFWVAKRTVGALTATAIAKFTHGDSEEDSARVYMHALRFMVTMADDRP